MKKCMVMFGLLLFTLMVASVTGKPENGILKDGPSLEIGSANVSLTYPDHN